MAYGTRRWIVVGAAALVAMVGGLLACSGGGGQITKDEPPPEVPKIKRVRAFAAAIQSDASFEAYSKKVGAERYVRLVVDIKTGKTYYFDVKAYPSHADFFLRELHKGKEATVEARQGFRQNYSLRKPNFLLLILVHHLTDDTWTLAFGENDAMTAEHVDLAFKRLKETFVHAAKVKFRLNSERHREVGEIMRQKGLEVVSNDAMYKMADYRAVHPGEAIGTLRIVKDPAANQAFDRNDIVLMPEALAYITPVAGIITEAFVAPAAHVCFRAAAWGIPQIGLKDAAKTYAALDGKMVLLKASEHEHVLRAATDAEVAAWKQREVKARKPQVPPADLKERELRPLRLLKAKDTKAYGAKAANLGELAGSIVPNTNVPAGYGIPIFYYQQHLDKNGIQARVDALLADPKLRQDADYRRAQLESLRKAIKEAPMDVGLIGDMVLAVRKLKLPSGSGVFVRSSTNAEDLKGFNGAGLYDTVPNVRGTGPLKDAVRKVWASVWNYRAFEEREFYGIDHRKVYGAVLVQVGVNATAAGVLITADVHDPTERGTYTITAKHGLGMKVVGGGRVPEQVLFDLERLTIKVVSRTDEDTQLVFDADGGIKEVPNPAKGEPILTDRRAYWLVEASRGISHLFEGGPLDIEWLFAGDRLHIVQVRPWVQPESW